MAGQPREQPSEHEVEYLLGLGLRLTGKPHWKQYDQSVETTLVVGNQSGEDVRLHARIVRAIPWRYHFVLRWGSCEMRKLDVRDSHTNPGPQPESWENRTHKHQHTDEWQGRWAYTPPDLPDTTGWRVSLDEYLDVFAAFCAECGIDLSNFHWEDPVVAVRQEPL